MANTGYTSDLKKTSGHWELFSLKNYFPYIIVLGCASLLACDDSATSPATPMVEEDMGSPCSRNCNPDNAGHQCCAETFGESFFCSSSLRCIEMAFCESDMELELCCQPGSEGDQLCEERLGPGSYCEAMTTTGNCTQVSAECPLCEANNEGHACCQEARGENAYCGGEGTCLEARPCDADDSQCCIPGVSGDSHCAENFGAASTCQQIGVGFRCSMTTPPCAGCIPDNEGHGCCQMHEAKTGFAV